MKLAIVVSHPIQYYAPLWRALAAEPDIDLRVIFGSCAGLEASHDREMQTTFAWATDLISGYDSVFIDKTTSVGQALSAFSPDAIVLHGYSSSLLRRALLWSKQHHRRTILIADSSGEGRRSFWRHALKRLLLTCYDAALTMGDANEDYLARHGLSRTRMFRMPTMMDEKFWYARQQRASLRDTMRQRLGLGEQDFVTLAVAKLSPRKRIADVIAAAAGLQTVLLIAGEGEERQKLETQARQQGVDARFLGFVNIDMLPGIYAAADVFVHPASWEPYGMVVVEAAILGLPMILSDETGAVGVTSIARPQENTYVYPCGDIAALRHHLQTLQKNRDLRVRMGHKSSLFAQDHDGEKSIMAVKAACKNIGRDLSRSNV